MKLKSKVCIITGSTSGIGRETAIELARQGAVLVLPVRSLSKGNLLKEEIFKNTGNKQVEVMECDLASFNSIRKFTSSFKEKYDKLHVLINNAGLWETKYRQSVDGIEMTFAVNHLAPFLLTSLLLDIMKHSAPGRIVNVSSDAHRYGRINFNDIEGSKKWNTMRAYSQSKTANILFTIKLAELLANDNITVNALHPGVVATHLFDKFPAFLLKLFSLFMLTPKKGAQTTLYLASSAEVERISGKYFVKKKLKKPAKAATNADDADKLWKLSHELTGLDENEYDKQSA